jgi:enoyl-CoA hydratase
MSLIIDVASSVATIRLNSPETLNALTLEMGQSLQRFLKDLPSSIKIIVLSSSTTKAFSAGIDLKEFQANDTPEYREAFLEAWSSLKDCPIPIIAVVQGYAFGGGLELALMADMIIAGRSAIFAQPELTVGTIPGLGATQRLPRAIGYYNAADLIFSGRRINAETALAWGLVSQVVEDSDLENTVIEFAKNIALRPTSSLVLAKKALRESQNASLDEGLLTEQKLFFDTFNTLDRREGFQAFIEKRPPVFTDP